MNYKLKKRDLVWNMYCPSTIHGILTPHGKIVLLKWLVYRRRVGYLVPLEIALRNFIIKQGSDIGLKLTKYLAISSDFSSLIPEAWNMPHCLREVYTEEECKVLAFLRYTAEKRFYYLPLMVYEFIKIQRDKSLRIHLMTYLEFRDDINVSVHKCSLRFVPELGITLNPKETQFWAANDIFTPDLRVLLLEQLKLSKC